MLFEQQFGSNGNHLSCPSASEDGWPVRPLCVGVKTTSGDSPMQTRPEPLGFNRSGDDMGGLGSIVAGEPVQSTQSHARRTADHHWDRSLEATDWSLEKLARWTENGMTAGCLCSRLVSRRSRLNMQNELR